MPTRMAHLDVGPSRTGNGAGSADPTLLARCCFPVVVGVTSAHTTPMCRPIVLVFAVVAGLLPACATTTTTPSSPTPQAPEPAVPDVHSHARPDEARVTHIDLELRPDFTSRTLAGT